jgi:hypothetical protein
LIEQILGQTTEAPNYFCYESNFTVGFTFLSSSHSAWQPSSNCFLPLCSVNAINNNSCRSSSTTCFEYRTVSNVSYCAPGALCSLLVPCNNITGECASNTSVCIINSCCAQQAVCLPFSLIGLCSSGNGTLFSSSEFIMKKFLHEMTDFSSSKYSSCSYSDAIESCRVNSNNNIYIVRY